MKRFISFSLCIIIILLHISVYAESATATLAEMYSDAELLMAQGDYTSAAEKFDAMGAYSDASQMAMYCKAIDVAETMGMYDIAIDAFKKLGEFKDCSQMAIYYEGRKYQAEGDKFFALDIAKIDDSQLDSAKYYYEKSVEIFANLALFKDCMKRLSECQSNYDILTNEIKNRNDNKIEQIYLSALALEEKGNYSEAIAEYLQIENYKDCSERILKCRNAINENTYQSALKLEEAGNYQEAASEFAKILSYKDSEARIQGIKELWQKINRMSKSKQECYNNNGKAMRYISNTEYIYDDKGRIIKEETTSVHTKDNSESKSTYTYEYYDNNNKKAQIDDNGTRKEYSKDGLTSVKKRKNSNGSIDTITETYNSYGDMLTYECKSNKGFTTKEEHTYKYVFNEDGSISKKIRDNGKFTNTYKYDSLGLLISVISEDSIMGETRTTTYTYERIQ